MSDAKTVLTTEQIAELRRLERAWHDAPDHTLERTGAKAEYEMCIRNAAPALLDAAERCGEHDARKAMATAPCDHATKAFVFSAGEDAPGKSLDTISQCKVCGAIIRDYRHGGGMTSPNYPMITPSPLTVPFLQLAQQLIESERERDELRNKVEALVPEWDYALGGAAQAHSHAVCPNCDNGDSIRAERDAATRERDEMARELERAREAMKKLHPRPSHGLLGDIGCVADRVGSNSDAWEELLRERDAAIARAEAAEKERESLMARIEEVSGVTAAECPLSVEAALAALDKLDRMRPVVEAAVRWAKVRFAGVEHMAERQLLGAAVDDYLAGEPKEGE